MLLLDFDNLSRKRVVGESRSVFCAQITETCNQFQTHVPCLHIQLKILFLGSLPGLVPGPQIKKQSRTYLFLTF